MERIESRVALRATYELAEGPVWDAAAQRLFWVDITEGHVHTGELVGDEIRPVETRRVDRTVGALALASTGLLVAGHHDVLLVAPAGTTTVARLVPEGQRRRLNDGKCDPAGRFLVGSLSLGEAGAESLWAVDPEHGVTVLDDDLELSNGLAWSPDGAALYSVDTTPGLVYVRSYDVRTGRCGERRVAFRVPDGSPDGMCMDTDGHLWVAVWGAGEVRRYTVDGDLLAVVTVAAPHTSCVAFAGPRLDRLVVTTAREGLSAKDLDDHPASGSLFLADVGARGLPTPVWPGRSNITPTSQGD